MDRMIQLINGGEEPPVRNTIENELSPDSPFYNMMRSFNENKPIRTISDERISSILEETTAPTDDCCSICYDDNEKKQYIKLKCGHKYHVNCIKEWLKRDNNKCPMCMTDVYN
jgi:hypothetical protein